MNKFLFNWSLNSIISFFQNPLIVNLLHNLEKQVKVLEVLIEFFVRKLLFQKHCFGAMRSYMKQSWNVLMQNNEDLSIVKSDCFLTLTSDQLRVLILQTLFSFQKRSDDYYRFCSKWVHGWANSKYSFKRASQLLDAKCIRKNCKVHYMSALRRCFSFRFTLSNGQKRLTLPMIASDEEVSLK